MLDIKKIRDDFEGIKKRVEYRGKGDFGIRRLSGGRGEERIFRKIRYN